jgi:6-phosphogluconate dehydrogenase
MGCRISPAILTKIAARDEFGRPCVTNIGTGGSGHSVKMIHNGIEHGVMSALCEAWGFMDKNLGMSGDDIADVFDSWDAKGGLVCFRRCCSRLTLTFQCTERELPHLDQRPYMSY